MKNKILHVVAGGFNQIPLVELAKSLGLRVLVTDMYENPPCRKLADFFESINTTDKEKTLEAAQKYNVDAVITDQSDVAVPTVAYIAETMNLEGIGYSASLRFTNKYLMRERLKERFPESIPPYYFFNDAKSCIKHCQSLNDMANYLIKPINSQGSKGVYQLDPIHYKKFINQSFTESRNRGVLLEYFIQGVEYSVESYKQDTTIYSLALTKKYHYASNDCIDVRNTYLGDVSPALEKLLFDFNKKVIENLDLPFGIMHAEYKVSNGRPYLIEIAARGGGGSISSKIIPFLTGFQPTRALIHRLLKTPFDIKIEDYKKKFAVMKFFDLKPGKIKNIYLNEKAISDILVFNLNVKPGDIIKEVMDSRDRPGYFVVAGENREDVLKREILAESALQIEYEQRSS